MPIFITQGRYSQQAIKGMADNPEDRAEPVRQLFKPPADASSTTT